VHNLFPALNMYYYSRLRPADGRSIISARTIEQVDASGFEFSERSDDSTLRPYSAPSGRELATLRLISPGPFLFVDSNPFQMLVGVVILLNMALLAYESAHPDSLEKWHMADTAILTFYCVELIFRMLHHKCGFLCHPTDALWNWIDLVIVTVGIATHVFIPLTQPQHEHQNMLYIGLGRFARILRCFKLCRVFNRASFVWTQGPWFQWTVASVILLNALVLGIETDDPSPLWWWVNQIMLLFFVFEIAVRMRLDGYRAFFTDAEERVWNILDFMIVVFGVADLWAARIVQLLSGHNKSTGLGQLMLVVRLLRLMRILRLLKLVKAVRPLYNLAMGVTQAMQSMCWVLVLMFVSLYAFAILATRMVGHALVIGSTDRIPPNTQRLFASISDSMFTLFSAMNGNDWLDIEPLLTEVPCTKPVFVIFTICSSWALLSVMTGVVSDHMMSVREKQAQKDEEALEERRLWLQHYLRGIFAAADKDGNGSLARNEYLELFKSPFHVRKLQQVACVPCQDLMVMFDWLDVDGNGEIEFKEFLHGFDWLNEPVTVKSLLKLGHSVRARCSCLEASVKTLGEEVQKTMQNHEDTHALLMKELEATVRAGRRHCELEKRTAEALREAEAAEASLRETKEALSRAAVGLPPDLPSLDSAGLAALVNST